jgi:hypothetical protein
MSMSATSLSACSYASIAPFTSPVTARSSPSEAWSEAALGPRGGMLRCAPAFVRSSFASTG